jgi:hypothetical protein
MAHIDECQVTNEWNDVMTFSYFQLVLCGQAGKWLSSIIHHLELTAAQKTWTCIRPVFKADIAAFSDDKLIIDCLAKLAHQPNENPLMCFSCLEELIFVLKESYASYRVKPERSVQQPQGGYSEDALTKAINDNLDNFTNFMFKQMFKAAPPENVRRLLSHKDQNRLTVEDAYKVFFMDHRLEMDKKASQIHAVAEESEVVNPEQQVVAAFQLQQRQQTRAPQQNFNRGNNPSRGQGYGSNFNNHQNSNQPKSNASSNGKFCVYCKILNHTKECHKHIQDNKPCVTNKGQLYWPKVNSTTDNPNTVQNNSDPNAITSVFL